VGIDVDRLHGRRADDRWNRTSVGDVLERVAWAEPGKEALIAAPARQGGIRVNLEACRDYDIPYMMRAAVFWMSAQGLFAEGRSTDLRLARTTYSLPIVLDMAAKASGF
jgi:hypothetical protein